jgi:Sulfotransferase domain
MKTFFVMSLPRSRTAWLANFLTYEDSYCFHEGLLQVPSPLHFRELFSSTGKSVVGNSDCGNVFFINEILDTFPDAKFVVVDRPPEEVVDSLQAMGPQFADEGAVWHAYELLQKFKREHDALVVNYDALSYTTYRMIWDHCVGSIFDHQRTVMLDGLDIQIIIDKKLRQIRESDNKRWLMEALN